MSRGRTIGGRAAPPAELDEIRALARPLGTAADLDPLLERIGDARYVLLGEASHGTAEYYGCRAAITRRLIAERGFSFVAVEGDWPDCFALNCWVTGRDRSTPRATDVLGRFGRWPTWMWANHEVAEFAEWLRAHNEQDRRGSGGGRPPVGFYGLDVYSLWDSMERVLGHVREREPDALETALAAARCFQPYGEDPQRYAFATQRMPESCERRVIELLSDLRRLAPPAGSAAGTEEDLDLVQNAEVVAGAERYYRAMVRGDAESWNVRDCHMVETLERLMRHHGPDAKAIVWEHNTHVGDARATDMASVGMINVGQVVRERHADEGVVLVGFGGYRGSVVAGSHWGAAGRRMDVPPAPPGTHEALIEEATGGASLFVFPEDRSTPWLAGTRGHRAIGVVYDPARDPYGNWIPTILGRRYDAFLSFPRTEALHPLAWTGSEPRAEHEMDTYPWAT